MRDLIGPILSLPQSHQIELGSSAHPTPSLIALKPCRWELANIGLLLRISLHSPKPDDPPTQISHRESGTARETPSEISFPSVPQGRSGTGLRTSVEHHPRYFFSYVAGAAEIQDLSALASMHCSWIAA